MRPSPVLQSLATLPWLFLLDKEEIVMNAFDLAIPIKEWTHVKDVKYSILRWFREAKSEVGHVITQNDLFRMSTNWNPKQRIALNEASMELIKEGLVEDHTNGLALTQKGVDLIY
jgi:hypothetical protein